MISIIVAYDQNRVIGLNGSIPWHLPEDLKLFKSRTIGHCVICGRKTWESLPIKPLPGRLNIVVSTTLIATPAQRLLNYYSGRKKIFSNLKEAVAFAKSEHEEVFIIGGAQIYKESLTLGLVDRIIASKVQGEYSGDTFFPELDSSWKEELLQSFEQFKVYQFSRKLSQVSIAV